MYKKLLLGILLSILTGAAGLFAQSSTFYEENGTIKCESAQPGETGEVNGIEYEAVDNALLAERRGDGTNLSTVCTTHVTTLTAFFAGMEDFNDDIGSWDTSNLVGAALASAFRGASSFNRDISRWDVSGVTDMQSLFNGAGSFNTPLDFWDVSSVINMNSMFEEAKAFNQDLNTWDVSSVTDMSALFDRAEAFNGDISEWDVSSVTDMQFMFRDAKAFKGEIGNWDVSAVKTMSNMFNGALVFNSDIGGWDVSSVERMAVMFANTGLFNADIGHWNVSSVLGMESMFYEAVGFNRDIRAWCVENIPEEPVSFAEGSFLQFFPSWGFCKSRPEKAVLLSPENNAEAPEVPITFTWQADALENAAYHIRIWKFDETLADTVVTDTSFTYSGPISPNSSYSWRVGSLNPDIGYETQWSSIWYFMTAETSVAAEPGEKPIVFTLEQNYPNPFNPATTIRYAVPAVANVELSVYNMLGQKVVTLVDKHQPAGTYTAEFDASRLSSGIYIYRLQAGGLTATRTLTLIK